MDDKVAGAVCSGFVVQVGNDGRIVQVSNSKPRGRKMGTRLGLIAGNGKFPFLVLDAAKAKGYEVVVAAIREEADPAIEKRGAVAVHWLSLGELSKLIETFKAAGVSEAIMAGQVKHKQIFSAIKPDWKLAKLLLSLTTRNTDSLIGAVAKVLADEGIHSAELDRAAGADAGPGGSADAAGAERSGADQHHLRTGGGASRGALRHWADGGDCRSGLRCD